MVRCAAEREEARVSAVWSPATVLMANARRGEKVCRGCHRVRNIYRINDAGLAGTSLRLHFAARTKPENSTTISREKVHGAHGRQWVQRCSQGWWSHHFQVAHIRLQNCTSVMVMLSRHASFHGSLSQNRKLDTAKLRCVHMFSASCSSVMTKEPSLGKGDSLLSLAV